MPVFQDGQEGAIPTVEFRELLDRFAGTGTESVGFRRLIRTGKYLVFHFRRFSQNRFFKEKNCTIVNFPIRDLDVSGLFERPEEHRNERFDLVGCVAYEGDVNVGRYKAFVHREAGDKFFSLQDLMVSEALPQFLPLSEVCLLAYRSSR